MSRYVVDGRDAQAAQGGKGAALARLAREGFPVPPWVAVLPEAAEVSLRAVPAPLSRAAVFDGVELPPAVRAEITGALSGLSPDGAPLAVRSSAADEDGQPRSLAGQLDSYLFVPPASVAARVIDVWRSAFGPRLEGYRAHLGLGAPAGAPTVLVQRMVDADVSGVAFGADPVTGRRGVCVVAAALGLGTGLVGGEGDADLWRVDRAGRIVERRLAVKRTAHRRDPLAGGGVRAEPVPDGLASAPALGDEQVRDLADLARRAGRVFGVPQDIEWAIEGGRIWVLQSRPITTLDHLPDPDLPATLWDNSNIAESYAGVTTPLTFSFARRAYEAVYREFCRLMGVPEATLVAHERTFATLLGLIRGRIYYNLLSWYRLLALLPGFTVNRRFMEQMMGVREGLPDEVVATIARADLGERLGDARRLAVSLLRLAASHATLERRIARFRARLDAVLGTPADDLGDLGLDELAARYRTLEAGLLHRWDAPIVNDFFAMIHFGVLRRLVSAWCDDACGTLQNDLVGGEGGVVGAEPARRLADMARIAAAHPAFAATLRDGPLEEILAALPGVPGFAPQLQAYLDRFGDRCVEELKLESPTLREEPLALLRAVGHLTAAEGRPAAGGLAAAGRRARAEARVHAALAHRPWRALAFAWVLRHARRRLRDRENLRFERTRVFARVRRLAVEMGRRLSTQRLLDDPRDIFLLEIDEVLGFVDGTATTADLTGLARVRRAELERHRAAAPPPGRFETRGAALAAHPGVTPTPPPPDTGDVRAGLGACPGVVRGRARVVRDPRGATLAAGEILVAERTDPGWIVVFAAAGGLVVEYGSPLSHAAIVARELGLPAVVALPGATTWLADGDWIEVDGSTGRVRRIPAPGRDGDAR